MVTVPIYPAAGPKAAVPAPNDLRAERVAGVVGVTLTWKKNAANTSGYQIWSSEDCETWKLIATLPLSKLTDSDHPSWTAPDPGFWQTWYDVTAYYGSGGNDYLSSDSLLNESNLAAVGTKVASKEPTSNPAPVARQLGGIWISKKDPNAAAAVEAYLAYFNLLKQGTAGSPGTGLGWYKETIEDDFTVFSFQDYFHEPGDDLREEILGRMMASSRTFKFMTFADLEKQVDARARIVGYAKNGKMHFDPKARFDVTILDDPKRLYEFAKDLIDNGGGIGCYYFYVAVMFRAVAETDAARYNSGKEIIYGDPVTRSSDNVPGDRLYIENPIKNPPTGYEGENIFYAGDNKWLGIDAPGPTGPQNLNFFMHIVNVWAGNPKDDIAGLLGRIQTYRGGKLELRMSPGSGRI